MEENMSNIKHFYNTADFPPEEIFKLINLALDLKTGKKKKYLDGKILAMLFFNPSLRTRVSFAVAMQKLGGVALDLSVKEGSYTFEFEKGVRMDKDTIEHVKEAAGVLSRYCNGLAIRASELITTSKVSVEVAGWEQAKKDKVMKAFMEYASVPVINMESNLYHPCQGLGDAMTIKEKFGVTSGKKYVLTWVYHPKALPMATPNSEILTACDLGMDAVIVHPKGWELDERIIASMERRSKEAGGSLSVGSSMEECLENADIVCAKSWGALKYYGNWEEEKKLKVGLKNWIVDQKKMEMTNNAYFMHCLPVRRNVEVTDEVIDGKNSIVIDQAENRLWVQMAILTTLLGGSDQI
ncbi:acetylornithine carbamoyltransferase [Candidatus Gottesmanbacteria bacterium CG11_big_fil_rev_8_21_14_0_20_37_11]|uniref:Acetylornithine carbamoyltransferase n=3 Tax=Candidatus Gottesmaniibacteriota TaxID=1752720 RepID=A0A2M7RQV3_9BACT|nr:MAG: acetylornithine carbamoyltransferase [Candidatus Gottesmanbacteria bacterium CG23_combo_of_CG06-09_8_20_14_all_37_19]PIR08244.1 MAG: acetylornithine carbamoyltransferase [Candidatus Gottesmanbacteria bacterium CG11_big_fil_rev_8_21_14_0_20_37_11]PIZ02697.1 MAG: acetylornithine carbamoyltransferase [Candidatus Gottesmanbacteria bacterium CG_4_10_14_0_8_um_filter_37_24]